MARWERAANLAERLCEVRVALGLTQEDFGAMMGVTDQTVSDYETGRSQPSKSRLERLAGLLRLPVATFAESGPMPSTLPVRLPEPRSDDEAGMLRSLLARLDFLRDQIKAYRDLQRPVGPEILAEWLEVIADIEEAKLPR